MTVLVIVGLVVVVALAVVWSRFNLGRSESRSMQSHEHSLQVLGDLTKRSDAAARINPLPLERTYQGHIRKEPNEPTVPLESRAPRATERTQAGGGGRSGRRPSAPSRRPGSSRGRAQPKTRIEEVTEPVRFEDDSDAFERIREEEAAETVMPYAGARESEAAPPSTRSPETPVHQSRPRAARRHLAFGRVSSVAALVLIVAALVLAGLRLTSNGTTPHQGGAAGSTTHKATSSSHRSGHKKHKTTTTTTPSTLVPVSTSSTDVAFVAPTGKYTVALIDTGGVCWVGIQQTSGGPYIWQETLDAGQDASYTASGPLVVRIGAPRYLEVKVNGVPARLPGFVQPYDLTFNPSSPPSSA